VDKVLVFKAVAGESRFGLPPPEDTPEYHVWLERRSNESVPEYLVVDPRYNSAEETPHEIEVRNQRQNELTVDVGSAVRIRMP
jgi:hypothetical protein